MKLNREHLQDLTNQVVDAMGIDFNVTVIVKNDLTEEILNDIREKVGISWVALAVWEDENGNEDMLIFDEEEINSFKIDSIVEIIRHELMHLITQEGDDSIIFQNFCRMSNIPLSGELSWEVA